MVACGITRSRADTGLGVRGNLRGLRAAARNRAGLDLGLDLHGMLLLLWLSGQRHAGCAPLHAGTAPEETRTIIGRSAQYRLPAMNDNCCASCLSDGNSRSSSVGATATGSTTAAMWHAPLVGDWRISPLPTLKRRYYIDLPPSCNAILARTSSVSRVYRKNW